MGWWGSCNVEQGIKVYFVEKVNCGENLKEMKDLAQIQKEIWQKKIPGWGLAETSEDRSLSGIFLELYRG